jgi:hypothetical protein
VSSAALHWTLLFALLAFPACASAQDTTDPLGPEFRALHNLVISADGAWMAAEERPDRGDGQVRVWSTERDDTFTIERGQNPCISRDSRWVSALQKPPLEDSRTATLKNQRAGQTLVLLDTQNRSRRTFDFVLSYDVTFSSGWLVYLQSPETKADEERTVGALHLVYLESNNVVPAMENVAQHAWHERAPVIQGRPHQTTDHFAYVMHDEETGRDTLHIIALGHTGGWGYRGTYEGEKIEVLGWARDPITVGFLDSAETTGKDGKRSVNSALYTWHVTGPNVRGKFTRVAQTLRNDSEFHALHNPVISADGAWVAAEERPDRGDGDVRVWSTQGNVTFTIERGQNPRFSRDSRWVSALQKPTPEDSRTANSKNKRASQTLVLLDTQDGSLRTFDFVLSYEMTYSSTYLLYLQEPETKADEEGPSKDEATKPAAKERKMGTLHQVPLNRARVVRIFGYHHADWTSATENVTQVVTHPTNDHFAYVFHDEETGGDTLCIVKWGIRSWYNGEKIEGLCWAGGRRRHPDRGDGVSGGDESISLGFLVSTETTGKGGKRRVSSALYTWQPVQSPDVRDTWEAGRPQEFTRVDTPQ